MGKGWKLMAILGGFFMLVTGAILVGMSSNLLTVEMLESQAETCPVCAALTDYSRWVLLGTGMILFVIPLAALILQQKKKKAHMALPCGEKGEAIDVTLACVREGIKGLATQLPDVSWVAADVEWRGGNPSLLVRAGLRASTSVRETASELQRSIKEYVNDVLGIVSVGDVRLIIEKIEQGPARSGVPQDG